MAIHEIEYLPQNISTMVVVGTHTSIAGGIENSFPRAAKIGGVTMQIFAKSPRGWKLPEYEDSQYEQGRKRREEYNQTHGLVHSNYLANLSKSDDELGVEIESIVHDFKVAHELGCEAVNVHVGKLKGRASLDEAMSNMVKNVEKILKQVNDNGRGDIQYLFENTAGQGSEIGSTLDELAYFYQNFLKDLPVKFTIDTAHCRGGGIDVTKWDDFVEEFDEKIGIEQLHSIHLNDAKVIVGSNLDRHASLGRGFIGMPAIAQVVRWAEKYDRPLYIETPEPELRPDEIEKVKKIAAGDTDRIENFHKEHYRTQYLKKFATQAAGGGLF